MQIAIIGPGAMGCLFGAFLSQIAQVILIHYKDEYVRILNEKGIVLEQPDCSKSVYYVPAVSGGCELNNKVDLTIIFTKSYKTRAASETAKQILKKDGLALTLQNGLGNLDIMEEILGKGVAVAGVTSHGATLLSPGHVRHAGEGTTYIARGTRNDHLLNDVVTIFNSVGIQTEISDNLDSLVWGKLIVNVGINALTAILRVPNGVLEAVSECRDIMAAAVKEAAAVATALKIELPYDDPFGQVKNVCQATAQNRSSMLQDILKGQHTEIDAINGVIEKKGAQLDIPTPANHFLCRIIQSVEATLDQRVH